MNQEITLDMLLKELENLRNEEITMLTVEKALAIVEICKSMLIIADEYEKNMKKSD